MKPNRISSKIVDKRTKTSAGVAHSLAVKPQLSHTHNKKEGSTEKRGHTLNGEEVEIVVSSLFYSTESNQ